ncbi:bacteriocin-type signal sequence [Aquimarina sp. AU58]|uniref:bacteriocin-type signal sequence n=1 Tax=Aquimarina sp. AU58 TaxID=1874112 RepID=UPI000D6E96A4|nr:bacteriocin-type signal sequence [Aquimarina sp. AU58]
MLSNILNLTNGKTLNKKEQQSINGGRKRGCSGAPCSKGKNGVSCCAGARCINNVCGYPV